MATVVSEEQSLLTDGDGLAMLRDASIGHIISKLNQEGLSVEHSESKEVLLVGSKHVSFGGHIQV